MCCIRTRRDSVPLVGSAMSEGPENAGRVSSRPPIAWISDPRRICAGAVPPRVRQRRGRVGISAGGPFHGTGAPAHTQRMPDSHATFRPGRPSYIATIHDDQPLSVIVESPIATRGRQNLRNLRNSVPPRDSTAVSFPVLAERLARRARPAAGGHRERPRVGLPAADWRFHHRSVVLRESPIGVTGRTAASRFVPAIKKTVDVDPR